MSKTILFQYNRSWQAALFEKIIYSLPLTEDERKSANYKKALIISQKKYNLPKFFKKQFNIYNATTIDNSTFEILPKNGRVFKTIYYIHGGAYWGQPIFLHYKMLQKIADQNQARIIMPIYPKSPQYTADNVLPYIVRNYKKCVSKFHIMSSTLTLMGDSAGGGLCLSLLQLLANEAVDKPSNVILFSPWLDISNSNPAMKTIQPNDPLLNIDVTAYQGAVYSGSFETTAPLISPLYYADLSKLPPVHVFTGTHDILYADIEKLSKKNNDNVIIYVYPKMNHVFVVLPIPEAAQALTIVSRIINDKK